MQRLYRIGIMAISGASNKCKWAGKLTYVKTMVLFLVVVAVVVNIRVVVANAV